MEHNITSNSSVEQEHRWWWKEHFFVLQTHVTLYTIHNLNCVKTNRKKEFHMQN